MHFLDTLIEYLKGVGPLRAELLKKELSIFTFSDLLHFCPFRYTDRSVIHKVSELKANIKLVMRVDCDWKPWLLPMMALKLQKWI